MAFLQITTRPTANFIYKTYKSIQDLKIAYGKWSLYRQTVSELKSLNSRELSDLGISTSMIKTIARESVYGK